MKKIFFINLLLSLSAFARDETLNNSLATKAYEPNYFSMILGLFLVVGMIYLTGFLYQKISKVNMKIADINLNKARIISTTDLGQNKKLHVVMVNDDAFLIASTQNNISYIKDVTIKTDNKDITNDKNC